jgi:hypothetical protein
LEYRAFASAARAADANSRRLRSISKLALSNEIGVGLAIEHSRCQ